MLRRLRAAASAAIVLAFVSACQPTPPPSSPWHTQVVRVTWTGPIKLHNIFGELSVTRFQGWHAGIGGCRIESADTSNTTMSRTALPHPLVYLHGTADVTVSALEGVDCSPVDSVRVVLRDSGERFDGKPREYVATFNRVGSHGSVGPFAGDYTTERVK